MTDTLESLRAELAAERQRGDAAEAKLSVVEAALRQVKRELCAPCHAQLVLRRIAALGGW